MNSLRNTSVVRFVAALLTVCLGAVVVSPAATAEGIGTQYADWLRLHLPESSQPDVERALEIASERGARTFEEFLTSFLNELESVKGEVEPVEIEKGLDNTAERLRTELRLQFVRFVGEAVLPGFLKGDVLVQTAASQNFRFGKTHGYSDSQRILSDDAFARVFELPRLRIGFRFLRSSAQPLGP
ncbi:MAG: hypothetical protein BMS9Abin05_0101 [Rhodothermia bacterium]|nr:MAG: hypothetical protein BMS9Abin05_0101 [Rhodothermia bacterium]